MLAHLFIALLCCVGSAAPETIAIRAGNLVDPASGGVMKNQVILVSGSKIVDVGPGVPIPAGAPQVDLSRAWVMPGLIDAHTHVAFTWFNAPNDLSAVYLQESTAKRTLRGLMNAQAILQAGFTTLRDVGNDADYAAVDLRDAIAGGWFVGPTLLTTGKIIGPFGGQSRRIPPEQGPFWHFEYIDADSADEVRKAVRQNIFYGADAIKLVADNSAYFYTKEEIAAAVSEAHAAGFPVSVHVLGGEAARNCILGGVDSIEHGWDLTDELMRLMKERGTMLVSTDFPEEHLKMMGMNDERAGQTLGKRIIDRLRRAQAAGVKLVFGTDTVIQQPNRTRADLMLDYLDVWKTAGMSPASLMKAMTANAAELLRIQRTRGAIAKGMAADIVATPSNPLDDIVALKQVQFVMKDGRVVREK
jgi:imidazolonepropionase-like amidohydrolase